MGPTILRMGPLTLTALELDDSEAWPTMPFVASGTEGIIGGGGSGGSSGGGPAEAPAAAGVVSFGLGLDSLDLRRLFRLHMAFRISLVVAPPAPRASPLVLALASGVFDTGVLDTVFDTVLVGDAHAGGGATGCRAPPKLEAVIDIVLTLFGELATVSSGVRLRGAARGRGGREGAESADGVAAEGGSSGGCGTGSSGCGERSGGAPVEVEVMAPTVVRRASKRLRNATSLPSTKSIATATTIRRPWAWEDGEGRRRGQVTG